MDTLLLECEILDWWEDERLRVSRECVAARQRIVDQAKARIDALTSAQLLRDSAERLHVERQMRSDITMFSRRMERSMRESAAGSMADLEGAEDFSGLGYREGAALAAGGTIAAGAVGAAAAASGLAATTTTTAILGLFTTGAVVTFSWPVFSAAAAVALVASYTSPAIVEWATSSLRERFKAHIEERATRAMVVDDAASLRARFLEKLDIARDRRLAALEDLT